MNPCGDSYGAYNEGREYDNYEIEYYCDDERVDYEQLENRRIEEEEFFSAMRDMDKKFASGEAITEEKLKSSVEKLQNALKIITKTYNEVCKSIKNDEILCESDDGGGDNLDMIRYFLKGIRSLNRDMNDVRKLIAYYDLNYYEGIIEFGEYNTLCFKSDKFERALYEEDIIEVKLTYTENIYFEKESWAIGKILVDRSLERTGKYYVDLENHPFNTYKYRDKNYLRDGMEVRVRNTKHMYEEENDDYYMY